MEMFSKVQHHKNEEFV